MTSPTREISTNGPSQPLVVHTYLLCAVLRSPPTSVALWFQVGEGGGTLPVRHCPLYQAGRHRCAAPHGAIRTRRIAIARNNGAYAVARGAGAFASGGRSEALTLAPNIPRRDACSSDGLRPLCSAQNHIFDPSFHFSLASRSDVVLGPDDRRGNARLYLYVKVRQWFSVLPAVLTPSPCSHSGEIVPPVFS